jgi:hypothetical protein
MKGQRLLHDMIVSVIYVLIFLLWKGIIFNTADQGEHLSLVYKALDPSLYPHDFYVDAAWNTFTIRFYYVHLVSLLAKWLTVEWAVNILLFTALTSSMMAWIRITRWVSGDKITGYLAPFLIFFIFYGWTIGGNAIQYNLLICSTLAKSIAPWALYLALRNRWMLAGVLLGISGLFQILVALQLALVLGAYLFLKLRWKSLTGFSMMFLLLVAPMLIPILIRQFGADATVNQDLFYDVLYKVRNPHHYLPSLFPLSHYFKAILLWVTAFVIGKYFIDNQEVKKIFMWMGIIISGLTVYSILLEVLEVRSIGKLQFFKTTIWMGALSAVVIAIAAEKVISRYTSVLFAPFVGIFLAAAWLIIGHFKNETPLSFDHRTEWQKELSEVHQWIAVNTPKDAFFATFASNESFICEAQRSQFVAWNPIIHEPWYINEWYYRFRELYKNPFDGNDYLNTLHRADEAFNNQFSLSAPFTHALMLKKNIRYDGRIIYESDRFVVLENTSMNKKH